MRFMPLPLSVRLLMAPVWMLIAPALFLSFLFWLLATETGLQTGVHWLEQATGGQIRASGAQGQMLGPLQLERLEIRTRPAQGAPLVIDRLAFDWQPRALFEGRVSVSRLHIGRLRLPQGDDAPLKLPDDLRLPGSLEVRIEHLDIDALDAEDDKPLLRSLKATLASDGQNHELLAATAHWQEAALQAQGRVMAKAPFQLAATLTARLPALKTKAAHLPASEWTARLSGTLAELRADLDGRALEHTSGLAVQGQTRLAPFEEQALLALQISAKKLNPRAFSPQAPDALLNFRADLQPDENGALAGTLQLHNEHTAPIDRGGLPLNALSSRLTLAWQAAPRRLKLDDLQLHSGKGQVRGTLDLAWPDEKTPLPQGKAKLLLRQFDPSLWYSTLRPFSLDGQIELDAPSGGLGGQSQARLALSDGPLKIEGQLRHTPEILSFERVVLQHGPARITGSGSLGLDARHPWRVQGKLADFDPALFARVPQAQINAEFSANGTLKPNLSGELALSFLPSQLADEALQGQAKLAFSGLDHPEELLQPRGRARLSGQVALGLGTSKLKLDGGWGRPEDHLRISLDLPALAQHRRLLPEAAGQLRLEGVLSGFPNKPRISLSAQAEHLHLPGRFQFGRLTLDGDLTSQDVRLKVAARGAGPSVPAKRPGTAIEPSSSPLSLFPVDFDLDLGGSRQQHQIHLFAQHAGQSLSVQMTGRLREAEHWRDMAWHGLLSKFRLDAGPRAASPLALLKNPALQKPAELRISSREIELQAAIVELAGGHLELLQTRWTPQGWFSRGRFSDLVFQPETDRGQAKAGLRAAGQWQLAQAADGALSGRVEAHLPSLGGLAALVDSSYTSAGSLQARLDIRGQTGHPQFLGEVRGEKLALGLPAYGLQLNNGSLALRLNGESVLVERLHFDAPHRPGERALKATGFVLPASPGQLDVRGEIFPWQQAARLDIRMTQLPVLQGRDRWLLLSGEGRLGQDEGALRLSARLVADAGFIRSLEAGQPRLSEDVVVLGRKPPASSSRLDADISLDLGEKFQLQVAGLKARLAGQIRLRGSPLQATGSITAKNATFEAYGQQLAVERGIVNFQGPIDNPGLNVLAKRQGGAVEAGVSITGTVRQPVVKLVSTPNVPDAEKLSWIVLGRAPDSGGTDTGALLAAAGSLLGGGQESLTTQLAQGLGVDEISLHGSGNSTSGSPTGHGLENQVITIGKRLSSRAYLSYDQGLSAARGALKLSYALSRRLSIVTRAGEEGAVDLFYNFTYD